MMLLCRCRFTVSLDSLLDANITGAESCGRKRGESIPVCSRRCCIRYVQYCGYTATGLLASLKKATGMV